VKNHRGLRRTAVALSGALVLALGLGVAAYAKLNSNISRVDVTAEIGADRPTEKVATASTGPLNILVLGSDNRSSLGTNKYGTAAGSRSDTTLLVHVSGDRTWVSVVSIPRDSMVKAPPNCSPKAPKSQWEVRQFNLNFNDGGPGCVIRTIEGNTGIFINHYAVVNFNGFKGMVSALGGVDVCTPVAIDDPDSGLKLTVGRHHLNGSQALGYVRVRETVGDGSDLGRIERQQAFMSSVAQEATQSSLLLRPDKLFSFLSAATQSLTTDPKFSLGVMKDLADSVKAVGMDKIQFATVPVVGYAPDPNRVAWASSADELWSALREDRQLGARTTPVAAVDLGPLTVSPSKIAVEVVNSSGASGLAGQAQAALRVQGFKSVTVANGTTASGAVVEYAAGRKAAATTVAAAFPGATLKQVSGTSTRIKVILGVGAPKAVAVSNRLGTAPLPAQPISADAATLQIKTRKASDSICG
jgi:LCP family protein required for cell wall assembly